MEGERLAEEQADYHYGSHDAGNQGGDGNALHPAVKSQHENGVPGCVEPIHQNGDLHGDGGISLYAENGCPGIVYGNKGNGCRHDHQIGVRICHNIRFDLSKYDMKDKPFSHIYQRHDEHRKQRHEKDKLLGRTGCLFHIPMSQELPCHHSASGGKSHEKPDEKHIDVVHQRYACHCGFTYRCYHDRVRHAYKHSKQLLHDHRCDKLLKIFICKK